MAEPTDVVRRWPFTEGSGTSVASSTADTDNLSILGSGGAWVTTSYPGLASVGYRFSRSGDGRAQTTITGSDLFGASEAYTSVVLATVDPADRDTSYLLAPSVGTSEDDMSGYIDSWEDGNISAGHVDGGGYEQISAGKDEVIGDAAVPHWIAVTATDIGSGQVQVRLWSWPLGGTPTLRNSQVKAATADGNNVDRVCVANVYGGGQGRGADMTAFAVYEFDRALPVAELGQMGITASNADPVCITDGDQTVSETAVVTVDLTGSSDVETAFDDLQFSAAVLDADGTGLVAGDVDVTTDHGYAVFTAPAPASNGIDLRFTVDDGDGGTDTADVTITVDPLPAASEQFPNAMLDTEVHLWLGDTLGWVDLTDISGESYVDADEPVAITPGRADWAGQVTSARCTLTLLDTVPPSGLWSMRNPEGPYFGLLRRNTPVRVKVTRANGYWRFHGYVPTWQQRWDPTGSDNRVPIEAHGILQRLEQWVDATTSVFRREVEGLANLAGYWSLEDPAATPRRRLSSAAGGSQMRVRGDAFPELASFDGFACSAPMLTLNDADLRGKVNSYSYVTGKANLQFGFLLHVADSGSADTEALVLCRTTGSAKFWHVRYETANGGQLRLRCFDANGVSLLSEVTHQDIDGVPLMVVVQLARAKNETAIDWTLYAFKPGGDVDGRSYSGRLSTTNGLGRADEIYLNPNGGHTDVAVGHVWVQSQISSPQALVAALAAYEGERAADRFARLCDEQGIPFVPVGDAGDTERMGPQRVGGFLALVRQCADADGGMLFEPMDQLALGYRTRRSLENQAAQIGFDYGARVLTPPLEPDEDYQDVRNDVTARTPDGVEARYIVDSGPLNVHPPDDPDDPGFGRVEDTVDRNVDEGRLLSHAGWWARLGTVDEPRYPSVAVSLSNPALVADTALTHAILSARVGDRLTIDGAPVWCGPDQVSQLIQGYSEVLTPFAHEIVWNCSPESPWRLPELDADTARLASSGSATTADFEAGTDTSMSVATTLGPLWTTKAGSWPFRVLVSGVVLEVTAVSGASSPQTFTVTQTPVNGVTKTIPSGSPVQVHPLARLRL